MTRTSFPSPSCAGVVVLLLLVFASSAKADDKEALLARLARVDHATSLESPELKPYTLKVNFQLYDDQGKRGEQGTLEEWWASPTKYKRVFTSPSYTATIIRNGSGFYRTAGAAEPPYLLGILEQQLNRPLTGYTAMEGLTPENMKTGPDMPECIMFSRGVRGMPYPPLGLFPTYCMPAGKDLLAVNYVDGLFLVERQKLGGFQGKAVAVELRVMVTQVGIEAASAQTVLTSHMVVLKQVPLTEADFTVPAGVAAVTEMRKPLPYAKLKPTEPGIINPTVPVSVRQELLSDPAQVRVLYGTDGRVRWMQLFTAPNATLAAAALQAVRAWTIHPQKDGDTPLQVETLIEVPFNRDAKQSETGGRIN